MKKKKNGMMWEFFPPGQPLEGMIHPWVVAIWNYQEVVDPSSAPQELNHSPDVLCILVVRFVETRGIYNHALGPICDSPLVFLVQESLLSLNPVAMSRPGRQLPREDLPHASPGPRPSKTMAFNAFSFAVIPSKICSYLFPSEVRLIEVP